MFHVMGRLRSIARQGLLGRPKRHEVRGARGAGFCRWRTIAWVGALGLGVCACDGGKPEVDAAPAELAYGDWGDPLTGLPSGADQLERVCSSDQDDMVHDLFCGDDPKNIESLRDLELAFGFDPDKIGGASGSALTGHSTSLALRSVSAINPRAVLFRLELPLTELAWPTTFVSLAFHRGEQLAEAIAIDKTGAFNFYLFSFEQDCNHEPEGCTPGDLLTPAVESDWRSFNVYDEASLANTVLDCAPCHQPDGPDTPKILRMQEFDSPWTHWFFDATEGGRALAEDYKAAKGDERLAGLPPQEIGGRSPGGLSTFVGSRDHHQPNVFHGEAIEKEVDASAAEAGGDQPFDNSVPGSSPTWQQAYERATRGESIPVPYHDVKVTDPVKLERMTEAYQAYLAGELDRDELPDLRDIFPDDPKLLAEMGMATEPGLSGEAVLVAACSTCHNERLDQSLSRARFRADLQGVSHAEKALAIERLMLPANDPRAMPPARLRLLTPEARERAIEALSK